MAQSDMVQSLLKAIDILRLIAESENGMRLNEIAEAFEMKKTTVHNLIRTLRARGFLEKDSSNRFLPGPAVQELALMRTRSHLLTAAAKGLRKIARDLPDTVLTVSEITPGAVVCRLRMSPDRPGELQHPTGLFFAPYLSATAVCLQANGSNGTEFELNFPFEEHGLKYWESKEKYLTARNEAQKNGFHTGNSLSGINLAVAFYIPENFALGFSLGSAGAEIPGAVFAARDEFLAGLRIKAPPQSPRYIPTVFSSESTALGSR